MTYKTTKGIVATFLMIGAGLQILAEEAPEKDILVAMPDEIVLMERCRKLGLHVFCSQTGLAQSLAKQELYPLGVKMAVDLAMYDYAQTVKNRTLLTSTSMNLPLLMKSFLQESPEAIEDLKRLGAME